MLDHKIVTCLSHLCFKTVLTEYNLERVVFVPIFSLLLLGAK